MYRVYDDNNGWNNFKTEEELREMFEEFAEDRETEADEIGYNAWLFDCMNRYDLIREVNKEELETDILAWFEENEDEFAEAIEDLDSWNGYLGDDRYYSMEELDEIFHDSDPTYILERAYFGYREGTDGREPFNPNDEYFRFNGYGNLVSAWYKDYSDRLDDYTVRAILENANRIDLFDREYENGDLLAMVEAWQNCEE